MVEVNGTTWGLISLKESWKKMQIEALKDVYEELKEMYMKRISFPQ